MKAILQRVSQASVSGKDKVDLISVQGVEISRIQQGLMVLVGLTHDDTLADLEYMQVGMHSFILRANKIISLRLFPSPDTPTKPWALSVKQAQLDILSGKYSFILMITSQSIYIVCTNTQG
jgi:D-Tyr-tRNAtyr deacylase